MTLDVNSEEYGRRIASQLADVKRKLAFYHRDPFSFFENSADVHQRQEFMRYTRMQTEHDIEQEERRIRKSIQNQYRNNFMEDLKAVLGVGALDRTTKKHLINSRKMMFTRFTKNRVEEEMIAEWEREKLSKSTQEIAAASRSWGKHSQTIASSEAASASAPTSARQAPYPPPSSGSMSARSQFRAERTSQQSSFLISPRSFESIKQVDRMQLPAVSEIK